MYSLVADIDRALKGLIVGLRFCVVKVSSLGRRTVVGCDFGGIVVLAVAFWSYGNRIEQIDVGGKLSGRKVNVRNFKWDARWRGKVERPISRGNIVKHKINMCQRRFQIEE